MIKGPEANADSGELWLLRPVIRRRRGGRLRRFTSVGRTDADGVPDADGAPQ